MNNLYCRLKKVQVSTACVYYRFLLQVQVSIVTAATRVYCNTPCASSHRAQSQKSLTHLHEPSIWPKLLCLSVCQLWHTATAFLGQLFVKRSTLYETELAALLLPDQHSPAARHLHHFDQRHLQRHNWGSRVCA